MVMGRVDSVCRRGLHVGWRKTHRVQGYLWHVKLDSSDCTALPQNLLYREHFGGGFQGGSKQQQSLEAGHKLLSLPYMALFYKQPRLGYIQVPFDEVKADMG